MSHDPSKMADSSVPDLLIGRVLWGEHFRKLSLGFGVYLARSAVAASKQTTLNTKESACDVTRETNDDTHSVYS